MQPRPILRHWKTLVLHVVGLAAAFAAGWHSPAWAASQAAISAKTNVSHLTPAQADLARILHQPGGNSRERDLRSWADGLDARMLKSMLAEFIAHPVYSQNNYKIMTILLVRLAKLDPAYALGLLKSICIHIPWSPGLIHTVLSGVAAKDPAAALAAIAQLPAGPAQSLALHSVLNSLVEQDPPAALAVMRNHPIGSSSWVYPEIFEKWAGNDPSSAASAALSLPPSMVRSGALRSVADAWAAQDAASALAWANGLPAGPEKANAVNIAISAMDAQDPTTAAAEVLQLPGSSDRNDRLINIATDWAQTDPAGALAWADKNLTGDTFLNAATGVLNQMGQTDPKAEAAALAQISDSNVITKVVPDLATNWAQQDSPAAMQWAQSLPADNVAVRNSAVSNVLNIWSTNDPAGAANYLQQNLASDPSFGTLATQVVNSWGSADPQAALTWAQGLPQGDAQNTAVTAAITQLAAVDPQAAWDNAQQLSGSSQNSALVNVINAWASQQPAQAAALLANLPQGADLATATGDVAKGWLAQDTNAATQWINTLPQGSARDNAVTQIVSTLGNDDPASALTWAASISDQTSRNTQVVKLATQWAQQNPSAAAGAVQNVLNNLPGLTPDQTTSLQKIVDKAQTP